MAEPTLKARIEQDMKAALKARDQRRLRALRLVLAALQEKEKEGRGPLDEAAGIAVLQRLAKQRREAAEQYVQAGRTGQAEQERYELELIQAYLPEPLDEAALDALVEEAIAATGAQGMRDMGKVMGWLKPKVHGRADMGALSARVKARLGG